jgi:hypothetical protein
MGARVDQRRPTPTEEGAVAHVAFETQSRTCRIYDLDLPYRIPGFGVGFAISKFKQIGVWDKLPAALRNKAREAKGSWSGLKLTQKDLDSVSDDAWRRIAAEFGVRWRHAATSARASDPAAA